jgi:hypothetical protein
MAPTDLSNLIQFRCVRADHQGLNAQDRVFLYSEGWAYCSGGRAAEDHAFIPTGGLERRRLEAGVITRRA